MRSEREQLELFRALPGASHWLEFDAAATAIAASIDQFDGTNCMHLTTSKAYFY